MPRSASDSSIRTTFSIIGLQTVDAAMIPDDDRAPPGTLRRGRRDAHPRADGAQPETRPLPGGGERQPGAQGPLARPAGDGRAHGHERPLVGAPADRAQPRPAPVPAAAPRRPAVER